MILIFFFDYINFEKVNVKELDVRFLLTSFHINLFIKEKLSYSQISMENIIKTIKKNIAKVSGFKYKKIGYYFYEYPNDLIENKLNMSKTFCYEKRIEYLQNKISKLEEEIKTCSR